MKNKMLTLVTTVLITGILFIGCQSSSDKIENARDKVQDAKDDVVDAKKELNKALNDSILLFKKESEERISNYEKNIAELKKKLASEKKGIKTDYQKKLKWMEEKNSEIKKKLGDFKDVEKDKWEVFKTEFNHDMDELGKAFKDMTVNNIK